MLRIGHLSTGYHTNFILIHDKKFIQSFKQGIDWKLYGTGPEMIQAFKNGDLDGGYLGLPPGIIGIDQKVTIKCVASGHIEGTVMISSKKYKRLEKQENSLKKLLEQFKGKTIGVTSKGSIHDVILNHYINKINLQDEIKIHHYNQAEFIAIDLMKGGLDAGVGTPALSAFSNSLMKTQIIIPPDKLWPFNPSYGIFFREELIKTQPQDILKFLKGHKKACFLLRKNPKKASEIIASSFDIIPASYFYEIIRISPKYCITLSDDYIRSTILFIKELFKSGYILREYKRDEIFYDEFVHQIHPEKQHFK
ncbi:MAG: ABC transporter substrate-binding protein [Promethearchaeota archaeon]